MPHFLLQLRPPRPSFPGDMTPDEKALMDAHVEYWAGHVMRDTALVFGPVFDPAGLYGLAIISARDDSEARALADADPVIKAARSFRYDIHPMQAATRPDIAAARAMEDANG